MASKFGRRLRRGIPAGGIGQLRFGMDFFHSGWGDWTAESIAEAKQAWSDKHVQAKVLADQARRVGLGPTFAELAFGIDGSSGLLKSIADLPEVFAVLARERSRAAAEAMESFKPEVME